MALVRGMQAMIIHWMITDGCHPGAAEVLGEPDAHEGPRAGQSYMASTGVIQAQVIYGEMLMDGL